MILSTEIVSNTAYAKGMSQLDLHPPSVGRPYALYIRLRYRSKTLLFTIFFHDFHELHTIDHDRCLILSL